MSRSNYSDDYDDLVLGRYREMHERLKNIIQNNCNTIGCKNCDLKFSSDSNSECSATELSSKIMEYENNNARTY